MDPEHGMPMKVNVILIHLNWSKVSKIELKSYVLFFNKNNQNKPDKKKINDIIKYNSGNGISPADKKLLLFASSISI